MISHISSAPISAYNPAKRSTRSSSGGKSAPDRIALGWQRITEALIRTIRALKGDHMAGRNFLFVPGPTNVPDRVLRAMAVPMEDHRSPTFPELARACLNGLKPG